MRWGFEFKTGGSGNVLKITDQDLTIGVFVDEFTVLYNTTVVKDYSSLGISSGASLKVSKQFITPDFYPQVSIVISGLLLTITTSAGFLLPEQGGDIKIMVFAL